MTRIKDLTGQRFGRLVVVERAEDIRGRVAWKCQCDCGNISFVRSHSLVQNATKSCGCLTKENGRKNGKENIKFSKEYNESQQKEHTRLDRISPNAKILSNNKSGICGVCWIKTEMKWMAYIMLKGKQHTLGRFINKQDAINARKAAEEKYFKPILEKYGKDV